jgi:hypothetical protein
MIYFISNATTGAIKIGYSKNPSKRLFGLQTATPDQLSLLGVIQGGLEHEAGYHERFASHRLQGEWFSKAILAEVLVIIAKDAASPNVPTTNVIVTGDTDFTRRSHDREGSCRLIYSTLDEIHAETKVACAITGGERDIEKMAWGRAWKKRVELCRYWLKWRSRGRFAPFQVGPKMLRSMFDSKVLLVFQAAAPSPSTMTLIRRAKKMEIPVIVRTIALDAARRRAST